MTSPFEMIKTITATKTYIMDDPKMEKLYVPFLINKSLSFFPDTIFYANDMNMLSHLDKKLQYDYLFYSIKARKRYAKWAKKKVSEDIDVIQAYYGYNFNKAQQALGILTKEQLKTIKTKFEKGGIK